MSKVPESGTSAGRAGTNAVGELPTARQALLAGLGVLFWGGLYSGGATTASSPPA